MSSYERAYITRTCEYYVIHVPVVFKARAQESFTEVVMKSKLNALHFDS